jgi:hypothetical protein
MAFVKTVDIDHWVGATNRSERPPWRSVEQSLAFVDQLNGKTRTQVVFQGDGRSLIVGGGNDGRYSVLTIGDDEAFYTLTTAQQHPGKEVLMVAGGQAGAYPAEQAVSLSEVKTAVEEFVKSGEPAAALVWQKD